MKKLGVLLALLELYRWLAAPHVSAATSTAQDLMSIAQQQLAVPAEFALGEMKVYRGEQLNRTYTFVMGKAWDPVSRTEFVRIDFQSAINSGVDSGSLYSDHRYLLKRTERNIPTQWLYLPALRRVRVTPYRPDDPLLQSDYLFYDLTSIGNLDDYRFSFVSADERTPIVEGQPETGFVPYARAVFTLERHGESYVVRDTTYQEKGRERQASFSDFQEVAPGRYRPHKLVVKREGGHTEVSFQHWTLTAWTPILFTPIQLETQLLKMPEEATKEDER